MKPSDRALDFGCGPGFCTREFSKRVGENGTVFAVDLQEEIPYRKPGIKERSYDMKSAETDGNLTCTILQ